MKRVSEIRERASERASEFSDGLRSMQTTGERERGRKREGGRKRGREREREKERKGGREGERGRINQSAVGGGRTV